MTRSEIHCIQFTGEVLESLMNFAYAARAALQACATLIKPVHDCKNVAYILVEMHACNNASNECGQYTCGLTPEFDQISGLVGTVRCTHHEIFVHSSVREHLANEWLIEVVHSRAVVPLVCLHSLRMFVLFRAGGAYIRQDPIEYMLQFNEVVTLVQLCYLQ